MFSWEYGGLKMCKDCKNYLGDMICKIGYNCGRAIMSGECKKFEERDDN